jgi:hypothetical protein
MHIEFVLGGEQMLKYCLENNKILKCGTNGSLCLKMEMASFGWLLIGTTMFWCMEWIQLMAFQIYSALPRQNCLV